MYIRATLLRRAGRRVPDLSGADQIEGEFQVVSRSGSLVAEIRAPMAMSAAPQATLHDVRLLGAGPMGWILRGFEQCGASAVMQEWRCEIVPVQGFDASGRPISDS